MTKKVVRFFPEEGDAHLPPRVTPTLVTPLTLTPLDRPSVKIVCSTSCPTLVQFGPFNCESASTLVTLKDQLKQSS